MQDIVYHIQYQTEDTYWWFIARNRIVMSLIDRFCKKSIDGYLLDIGCGTGGFSKLISENYKVAGLDTSPIALEYAKKRGLKNLFLGLLHDFPKNDYKIGGALMLDVVEHIEDDKKVLREVYDLLPENGWFFVTVPAYMWLWSIHDTKHMHYRRYTKRGITKLMEEAGFDVKFSSYFNTFLFPLAVLSRLFNNITGKNNTETAIDEVSPFVNKIFKNIFLAEVSFLKWMRFPFGVSIAVVAQKKTQTI